MSTRRVVLAAAGAVVFAVGVAGFTVRSAAETAWERAQAWMVETERAWHAQDFARPVAWGESHPGNAFEHYGEAQSLAAELLRRDGETALLNDLRLGRDGATGQDLAAARERWAPVVAAMREGACRGVARPDPGFGEPFADCTPDLLANRWVVNMACLEARIALDEGHTAEAVELTLDAAAFGADTLRSPSLVGKMIAAALLAIATDDFWTSDRLARLDEPALALLGEGLRRIDERVPVALDFATETLLMACAFGTGWSLADLELTALEAWRHGFSSRGMIGAAILDSAATHRRLASCQGLRWPERERALQAEADRAAASTNPIVRASWVAHAGAEHSIRQVVAELRMLRIAVATLRGESIPELEDPLGAGGFAFADGDGELRIASAGNRGGERTIERVVALPSPR